MFRTILVAVDDTASSHRAVHIATDLAQRYHARLCLLHAFPHISEHLGSPTYDRIVQEYVLDGQHLLETIRTEIVEEVGDVSEVDTQLIEGAPASAILDVAEVEHADLIVMGTRSHHQFMHLLMGSVSTDVTRKAHCPVMVVH
ncbi:MAG: universal stress protein [Chloroflexaceae bacterium]|nr:universal stress protein [Chloroflexaceae bacterium]NJO05474.1 universal stress protein [Chloroflexaceae bacterium]